MILTNWSGAWLAAAPLRKFKTRTNRKTTHGYRVSKITLELNLQSSYFAAYGDIFKDSVQIRSEENLVR